MKATTLVCLPTLNEEQSIANMVNGIKKLGYDVLVCDAGSKDKTVEIAREAGVPVVFRDKPGKGSGIKRALKYAEEHGYDYILLIDCDETYPIPRIPALLAYTGQYDMIVGARNFNQLAMANAWANRFFVFVINTLFNGRYTDAHSGMRAMRVKTFKPLVTVDTFDVETEIACRALKHKVSYIEVPVEYAQRAGESKVSYWLGFRVVGRILKERLT